MQNAYIKRIYNEVVLFCQKKGLIYKLEKSLLIPESDRFSKLDIDEYGLDVLDTVHCLVDKGRTFRLMDEINQQVLNNDIVIEAGIGTGILSFVASLKAERVYAFEVNNSVFSLANEIKQDLIEKKIIKDNIVFIEGDAREIKLSVTADILISENLYTGMFFEKQVEIIKSLKKFLRKDGKIIPSGMRSTFFLCESGLKKEIIPDNLYVVSEMSRKPHQLSIGYVYDNIDFKSISAKGVIFKDKILVNIDGYLDSILICSDVILPSSDEISRYDTSFMNNDILLSLNKSFKVTSDDILNIDMSYLYGSDPRKAKISINKL